MKPVKNIQHTPNSGKLKVLYGWTYLQGSLTHMRLAPKASGLNAIYMGKSRIGDRALKKLHDVYLTHGGKLIYVDCSTPTEVKLILECVLSFGSAPQKKKKVKR